MPYLKNIVSLVVFSSTTILLSACSPTNQFDPVTMLKTMTAITNDYSEDELKGNVDITSPTKADFERLSSKILADPKNAWLYRNRGRAYYFSDFTDRNTLSLSDYNKAIALVPWRSSWYAERSNALAALKRHQEALNDMNLAIMFNGIEASYYSDRANIYEDLGRDDEAFNDYVKAAEFERPASLYSTNLAKTLEKRGRHNEAIVLLRKVIAGADTYWACDAHKELVAILMTQGKFEQAQNDVAEWKSAMPKEKLAVENSARMLEIFHPETSDKDLYNQLVNIATTEIEKNKSKDGTKYAGDYEDRADYYEKLGQLKQADADRRKALEIYLQYDKDQPGNDIDKLSRQATLSDKLHQPKKATELRSQALKLLELRIKQSPQKVENYHARGVLYLENKNYQQALSDFEQALVLTPNDNHYIGHHADCLNHLKRYQEAFDECQKGIKASKHYREYALGALTEACERLGKHDDAITYATELTNTDRREGDAFYWRSMAYESLGKADLAKRDRILSKWFKSELGG